jgi:hypothetical protein
MSPILPRTNLLLVNDYKPAGKQPLDIDELRRKLSSLLGLDDVTLTPYTPSTVTASVPARNQRERDRLKALVNEKLDGWHVLEEQTYGLPKTF